MMPRFGIYGAAYGVCAAAAIRAAITIVVSRRVFPIHFELGKLLQLGVLTLAVGGLGLQCPATVCGVLAKVAFFAGWLLAIFALAIVPRSDFREVLRFVQSLLLGVWSRLGKEPRLPVRGPRSVPCAARLGREPRIPETMAADLRPKGEVHVRVL
jgi:sulfite exporter TauE/SafE